MCIQCIQQAWRAKQRERCLYNTCFARHLLHVAYFVAYAICVVLDPISVGGLPLNAVAVYLSVSYYGDMKIVNRSKVTIVNNCAVNAVGSKHIVGTLFSSSGFLCS